ncbi:MAG: class I SAM-dependent RNA methyltransferase, partial [Anaerotardibacter sp.]
MTERIEITKLTHGPNALGRCSDGKVVFVPHAAPGDIVDVEFTKETASFREGVIKNLVEPGFSRTEEACPFAGVCGGCNWMHISYEEQLRAKREDVLSQLIRVGKVDPEKAEEIVDECVGSKRQLGYRNKIELACGFDERARLQVGFHKHASSEIITPKTCPLAVKGIQKAPQALKGALAYLQGTQDLGLIRIGVRGSLRTKDCEIALWTKPGAFPRAAAVKTLKSALDCTSIVRVMAQPGKERKIKGVEALYGKGCFEELLCNTRFKASAPSFFQVNTGQAETLVSLAIECVS